MHVTLEQSDSIGKTWSAHGVYKFTIVNIPVD